MATKKVSQSKVKLTKHSDAQSGSSSTSASILETSSKKTSSKKNQTKSQKENLTLKNSNSQTLLASQSSSSTSSSSKQKQLRFDWDLKVPHEHAFYLANGKYLYNIVELVSEFDKMTEDVYRHHVSFHHNDFANWIEHVHKLEELAKELRAAHNKDEMQLLVLKYIVKHV
jgi:hypothetical protein